MVNLLGGGVGAREGEKCWCCVVVNLLRGGGGGGVGGGLERERSVGVMVNLVAGC